MLLEWYQYNKGKWHVAKWSYEHGDRWVKRVYRQVRICEFVVNTKTCCVALLAGDQKLIKSWQETSVELAKNRADRELSKMIGIV